EQDARIRALEEELAACRGDLENERQMRMSEENQRHDVERAEDTERAERFEQQLLDVTNIVSEQRDEMIRKKEEQEQKWADKMARMTAQEEKMDRMLDFMSQFRTEKDDDKVRQREEQDAMRADVQNLADEFAQFRGDVQSQMRQLVDEIRNDILAQQQANFDTVRATAQEQVPFNIQKYLDEFSKALAIEVRQLLQETGRVHQQLRTMQAEIGHIYLEKSRLGLDGKPDGWAPPNFVPVPAEPEPVPEPEAAEDPITARPVPPPAPAPPPAPSQPAMSVIYPPVARHSFTPWQPDPQLQPSPASNIEPVLQPELLHPQHESPGLFGPRSPRNSLYRQ
ncbi:hypothetical protein EIP91_002817, partial [Steccherinum ochraceum]